MLFDPILEIEGYAEAVEREQFVRNTAFIGSPQLICGIEVSPLTTRHFLWLELIQSPFVGGEPDIKTLHLGVAAFFKTLAPQKLFSDGLPSYLTADKESAGLKTLIRAVGKLKFPVAIKGIREFVNDAFMDAPGGAGGDGKSYYSMAASIAHSLCANYKMTVPEALDTDLKIAFQLMKVQRRMNDSRAILFNPSDTMVTRHFQKLETENRMN